jgi:RNA polymerase sigma factor (sigma-70 family)
VDVEWDDAGDISRSLKHPECFAAVFDHNFRVIYAYLARRVGPELAPELAQDTFLQAFSSRATFDPTRGSARSWLFGIATNIARHHARSEHRQLNAYMRSTPTANPALDEDSIAERVDASNAWSACAEALLELDPAQREALLLLAWADLSYPEIAEALEIPIGTARSRIHRAREHLRELLAVKGQLVDEANIQGGTDG